MPPAVPAACAAPTTTAGATWKAATGERFWSVASAWGGKEAAVAYAESTATSWNIKLQRLTEAGAASGAIVAVGSTSKNAGLGPVVTLATDGGRYIVCWDGAGGGGEVACAAVPVGTGPAVGGLSVSGTAPSVAFGAAGWAVAYATAGKAVAQALGKDANASGSAVYVATLQQPNPHLVATKSAFAVVAGAYELFRLDAGLHPMGSGVKIGSGAATASVAASGDAVGVAWADGMQDSFVVDDSAGMLSSKVAADDGKGGTYGHVGAAAGAGSFVVVWSDFGGTISYRAIDGTGKLLGTPKALAMTNWDDNPVAVTGVGNGFLAVAAGGISLDQMIVTHVGCP